MRDPWDCLLRFPIRFIVGKDSERQAFCRHWFHHKQRSSALYQLPVLLVPIYF